MILLFGFTVDKATNTIHVTREFAADLDLVWDVFTKAEMLDQWGAPKPWRSGNEGNGFPGRRSLDICHGLPRERRPRYSLVEFIDIQPKSSFTTKNSFCDENGNPINTGFSLTKTSFNAGMETTTVRIEKKFDDLSVLEMMVSRGFKEGTAMAMNNLDEFLRSLVAKKNLSRLER